MIAAICGVLAMAGQPGSAEQQSPAFMIGWLIIMLAIFYMLLVRPQQKKEKERRQMIDSIKSGDRVVFGGGIIGVVTNVKDKTFTIKIADKVKVEVIRGAISQVLSRGESPPEEVDS